MAPIGEQETFDLDPALNQVLHIRRELFSISKKSQKRKFEQINFRFCLEANRSSKTIETPTSP